MLHSANKVAHPSAVRDKPKSGGVRGSSLRRLLRRAIETLCAGMVVLTLVGPVRAEERPTPDGALPLPAAEVPAPSSGAINPITGDPYIMLRGSVWRTKTGIVFLKTPIGLLTLSSKTTLKDLKASQEVHFWVHDRHSVVEVRKRTDGSLVHRFLSGPMTSGGDTPRTLRWWGPDGDQTVNVGTQEEQLTNHREGDPLTVEVDDTNTITGVHDLQFDLQVSQAPPAGSDVQLLLSGTVTKLKSNFVFVRTPVGLVMLNSKIGIPQVKVGQPLTLHIDHERVTVTLPPTKTATPRRNTSPMH
ncbi:MAG: hypothetical protein CAF43_012920 [Nitrospira sp. CG24C]|nr:MAG: hypothetical protein CAF43_012920 [Nitrospira sp. CG24C]